MTPNDVLRTIRATGRTVERTPERTVKIKPGLDAALRKEAVTVLAGVKCLLDAETPLVGCARCGTTTARMIVAYWGPTYCPDCCMATATELDRSDAWPTCECPTHVPDVLA